MSSFYLKLGKKIKELREQSGISQEKLAAKLEIPRPAISQIERGERTVTADELFKLSEIFHIPVDGLLNVRKEPEVVFSDAEEKSSRKVQNPSLRIHVPQKNLNKFREVLLYILDKVGSKPNIGETVIYKLLYFMDFDYYEKYEEQLIGAQYMKNRYGPTPVEFRKVVEKMMEANEIEKVKSNYFQYPQTKYLPLRKPNLKKLTAQEVELIEDVLHRIADKNAQEISDYSHHDVPWRTANDGSIIEYESVFYRTPPYSVREYAGDVS
ncbi:MAG: DUF4065 domain-containing protein [Ignavibacteriae bacterium]|nr:DUF4065 domain-containing protein [Ignavibacteriota bacterium]